MYDNHNIFAKILRGDIPNKTVLETEHALAFEDIAPQAPTHILVIPKGAYRTYGEFLEKASAKEQAGFHDAVRQVIASLNLEASGYRIIINAGENGCQEVPHLHFHILAGKTLGRLLA